MGYNYSKYTINHCMKRMKLARAGYEPNEVSKSIRVTQDIEQSELTVAILGTEVTVFTLLIGFAIIIAVALTAYVYLKLGDSKDQEPDDLEIYTKKRGDIPLISRILYPEQRSSIYASF